MCRYQVGALEKNPAAEGEDHALQVQHVVLVVVVLVVPAGPEALNHPRSDLSRVQAGHAVHHLQWPRAPAMA